MKFEKPRNLRELVLAISSRPSMFSADHRFYSAASFIEGYAYARDELGVAEDTLTLRDFSLWLSERLGRQEKANWAWMGIMLDYYKSDVESLENLPVLFEEFMDSRKY